MSSINSLLPKRRYRSSRTISPETQLVMDKEDLDILVPKKRMRSVMSLQACAARTGDEGEFNVEPVAKIGSLRSRELLVSKISSSVIGVQVPKKTRSACVKRLVDEYPPSDCYNYQQHSNLGTSENEEPRQHPFSMSSIKLSIAVNEDLEMEVAEVLLGLGKKQSQLPDYATNSQQKPVVSNVKESGQIKEDVELWSVKNKVRQDKLYRDSEIKVLNTHIVPDGLENLVEDDALVNERKKGKPFLITGDGLAFASRKLAEMKVIQMATLPDFDKGKSDILLSSMSQNGRKRCATHFYIAQSIMNPLQCNKVNLLSSPAGSACSILNSSIKKDVNERSPKGHILNRDVALESSNVTKSACPQNKKTSTEVPCLPDSAQRKHPNHEAPKLLSSEKKLYQIMGLKSEMSGTCVSPSSLDSASRTVNASAAGDKTRYSTFSKRDPVMSLYNSHPVTSKCSPFMTMISGNDYAFPISSNHGNSSSFNGGTHGHVTPNFNGTVYTPPMFYPPQLLNQQPTHPQTLILSPTQNNTQLSHTLSSHKQRRQQQKNGSNVSSGHNFLSSATMHFQSPQMQHIQPFRQSHKLEEEFADKKPLVDNLIRGGQGSAQNQHSPAPLQHMHSTKSLMVARNSNMRRSEKHECVQGPMVGCDLTNSQSNSVSYSPICGSSDALESLPAQNFSSLLPSPSLLAHQRYLVPQIPDVINNYYPGGGKAWIDFKGADSARTAFTGKFSSCLSQSSDISKAIPYDQTGLVKGCSIFDRSAKNLSSYTASMSNDSGSHYGIKQHHAQGIWNKTSTTNGQSLSLMSTRESLRPAMMSHPANWNCSARFPVPQFSSTLPWYSYNPPHQQATQPCTSGGKNVKSVAAQENGMSVVQAPSLENSHYSPSPKSCQSSPKERKSGSVASPTCETNGTSSSYPIQQNLASPVNNGS